MKFKLFLLFSLWAALFGFETAVGDDERDESARAAMEIGKVELEELAAF